MVFDKSSCKINLKLKKTKCNCQYVNMYLFVCKKQDCAYYTTNVLEMYVKVL